MADNDILLTLLSMGFEPEECHKVMQTGITDIQDAIQHLLLSQSSPSEATSSFPSTSSNSGTGSQHATENRAASSSHETPMENAERNAQIKASYNEQMRKRRLEERIAKERILRNVESDKVSRQEAKKVKDNVSDATASKSTHSDSTKTHTRVQVRLPDGTNIQLTFERGSTLRIVYDAVLESVEDKTSQYCILQPFPRKEFTEADMSSTLAELGLVPSARLVLSLPRPEEKIDVDTEILHGMPDEFPTIGCTGSRLLQGNIQNDIHDSTDPALENVGEASHVIVRNIQTLQKLCADCVAQQLTVADTKTVNSMSLLSSNAATQVINVLKSMKLLSAKLMSCFLPCKLKELNLDSYGIAANELLEKLRFHTSITSLSLRSCGLLNDHGVIPCLKGLPNLKYLNLADCSRLTGTVIEYVADLPFLEVLILDKFKVADESLNTFLKIKLTTNLKKLSLDLCPITSGAFADTPACNTLLSLSLSGTKVQTLDFLQKFPNLSKLHIKNTLATDDDFQNIRPLNKLSTLKFSGSCITDTGLVHITGLQLKSIDTVDRQKVTNDTVSIIKNFPLTSLDLSDHIYLSDGCIPFVSQITSLTSLSLSNTKITGIILNELRVLHDLDTLDLSKTIITNDVVNLLKDLHCLHTINLAWTKIDDEIIKELNNCRQISKLNLSHTDISDNGIVHLRLGCLDTLLLDSTKVTWNGASTCIKNCPNITLLRNSSNKVHISNHR